MCWAMCVGGCVEPGCKATGMLTGKGGSGTSKADGGPAARPCALDVPLLRGLARAHRWSAKQGGI